MKLLLVAMILLGSVPALASDNCVREAVRAAKENAIGTSVLHLVQTENVSKPYLEAYKVVLVDRAVDPRKSETYAITLMKSDCAVISIVPEI